MKKKILITGSNGLLGQKLIRRLSVMPQWEVYGIGRGQNRLPYQSGYTYYCVDLTNPDSVRKVTDEIRPDVVIHAAAMTQVDECELKPGLCELHNVKATEYLLDALKTLAEKKPHPPHVIFLSTDFIFDGTRGPVSEEEKPHPLSVYAHSKLRGEELVQASGLPWSIARTVLVYGVTEGEARSNVVLWVKKNLEEKKPISVVDDQYRTPTLSEDLAEGCIRIAERSATGIYHISGKDFMNIYELACRVADFFKLDKTLIRPSKTSDIRQPAKRPPVTGFIIEKARRELGYEPHSFEEGLEIVKKQLSGTGFS